MVNTIEFIQRIKKVMDFHSLNASLFADNIGVQRSSISHLLSGRNKPSLDFVLKVTEVFEEVDLDWLIHGKGSFPKSKNLSHSATAPLQQSNTVVKHEISTQKKIQRVLVFYADGTFEEYNKQKEVSSFS